MSEDPPIPVRYVILLELLREGPLRASDLVEPTDLTLQGVSYNLKQLQADGLVSSEGEDERAARITEEGIEALHDHFLGLKAFVDHALGEMMHVEECVALADEALEPGDQVGLFMEDGRLVARAEDSPSTGRIRKGGPAGDLVTVSGLSGVVDLEPGTIDLVRLPPPASLPEPDQLADAVASLDTDWVLVATAGLEADVLADRAGLEATEGPVRFAAEHVARQAAQVGLDVLVVAAWEDARRLADALREGEGARGEPLTVRVHDVGSDGG